MRLDKLAAEEMGLSKEDLEAMGIKAEFPDVELPQPEVSLQDVKDTFHKWLYIEAGEDIVLDVVHFQGVSLGPILSFPLVRIKKL